MGRELGMEFRRHHTTGHSGITFPDHESLSREECYELIKIYRDPSVHEDKRTLARNLVAERHQKFIAKSTKSFWENHTNKNLHDLWEAASEGFLVAFDKVDVEKLKYIKFYTYAAHWVKAFLTEAAKNSGNMRYSSSKHREMNIDHKKTREECKTLSPIQAHHKWNEFINKWGSMQSNMGSGMASLDQKNDPNSNSTIADTIPADADNDTLNTAGRRIIFEELHKAMKRALSPIESRVLSRFYGIESKETNFKELSTELNIPKNDVKKIRDIALTKMRRDVNFKRVLSSLNIMTSISNGSGVFSLLTNHERESPRL